MIRSFADERLRDIFHGNRTRRVLRIDRRLWDRIADKLDQLDQAETLQELMEVPGNRFERLRGDLAGRFSIRVNDQFRLVFKFDDGDAIDVEMMDYHR